MDVNLAVIYYSATGTIQTMAERLRDAGERSGARVRMRPVSDIGFDPITPDQSPWLTGRRSPDQHDTATPADVRWADAVLFGTPARFGAVAAPLKAFLESLGPLWVQGLLSDIVYAGFTASRTTHGGQESTLLGLYTSIYHLGGVVVAPGYTDPLKFEDGNPYGVAHATGVCNDAPLSELTLAALDHLAERVIDVAGRVKVPAD